jgi:hypothetical protein
MYPEKFTFENLQHRTAKINFLLQLIYQINSMIRGKKDGLATVKRACPFWLLRLGSNQRPSD